MFEDVDLRTIQLLAEDDDFTVMLGGQTLALLVSMCFQLLVVISRRNWGCWGRLVDI